MNMITEERLARLKQLNGVAKGQHTVQHHNSFTRRLEVTTGDVVDVTLNGKTIHRYLVPHVKDDSWGSVLIDILIDRFELENKDE